MRRDDDTGSVLATCALLLVGIAILSVGGYVTYAAYKQRGIRNNNPGNLTITDLAWKGKVPREKNTDGHFEQFQDYNGVPGHIWGLRANYMDIRGDVLHDGLNTVAKLITSYAPPTSNGKVENDTAAYIAAVSKSIGKPATATLVASDLPSVLRAIIKHEEGIQPYPDADIAHAIALA